jgi:HD-GYP domain-containing protein (c-di-GMP phosphodiesterase class II)
MAAVRLADLLTGLSRLADYGFGLQVGSGTCSCVLAARLARSCELPEADVRATFFTAMLHHIGCVGYAHETSKLFGDDLVANAAAGRTNSASPRDLFETFLPTLTQGRSPLVRARLALTVLTRISRWGDQFTTSACEVGRDAARRLELPEGVRTGLFHVYDMWRGERRPRALAGDEIPVSARIARLTGIAVMFESVGGTDLAIEAVRTRAGGMLDPSLVARFTEHARSWFGELADADVHAFVLDAEPHPHVMASDPRPVAELFGDLADLKSPYTVGHSRAVAALAGGAADQLRLQASRADLELAGLLHDVGRVAVSNAVWDKPGRLTADEWEQVRLHPYYSERILAGSSELARLAPVVARHHERLDGSGYHRGSTAADLSMPARILAAADGYQTAIERRPHRAALSANQARRRLLDAAGRGVLDADAVDAVISAAGHPVTTSSRRSPSRLSDREVEVLSLVAQGCSNAEVASRLVISRRTAEHHVQHIYAKIGVSSRAAATLYAVEHHLL